MRKKNLKKRNQELVLDHVAASVLSAPRQGGHVREGEKGGGMAVTENDGEVGPRRNYDLVGRFNRLRESKTTITGT